jgi:hypothetical protein
MEINAKLHWLNKNIALYLLDVATSFSKEENREQMRGKHCLIEILRTCDEERFINIMRYLQTTHLAANKIEFFLERIAEFSCSMDTAAAAAAIKEEVGYQRWTNVGEHRAHTITVYLLDQPNFPDTLIENLPK